MGTVLTVVVCVVGFVVIARGFSRWDENRDDDRLEFGDDDMPETGWG